MITREYLANYPYLQTLIDRDTKKLEKLRKNPPVNQVGVVKGSCKDFPYLPKGFYVGEPNIVNPEKWEERVRNLEIQIQSNRKLLEQIMFEIDEFISSENISPRDRLVFEYLYQDGMTQQEVADKLFMERSNVSKIIDKYIPK